MDGLAFWMFASAITGAGCTLLAKILFDWLKNKRNGNPTSFHDIKNKLEYICKVVGKTDEDGRNLCYTPRSMIATQTKIIERLDTIINLLGR